MKKLVREQLHRLPHAELYPAAQFDEAGWNAIINLMKHVNVSGIYQGAGHKASPVLDHNQKQLAAYLARARGPGETS